MSEEQQVSNDRFEKLLAERDRLKAENLHLHHIRLVAVHALASLANRGGPALEEFSDEIEREVIEVRDSCESREELIDALCSLANRRAQDIHRRVLTEHHDKLNRPEDQWH
ncbi:MAG: hypothetical protein OXT63_06235 [Gemmatimonadota bacterium]|nr:hypothetical protein [Gemmatimonadota bacterium]